MYPRNAASPPTVAVGSIYLIADGTIQTSGASVRVKTGGGAWGAGGGSLGYDATSGAIIYTPTQAETNDEEFHIAVYKASCTTACVTVVTTANATAGKSQVGGMDADVVTDASLAGNMEIVFVTDFGTNYNTTRNAWATNAQDFVGTTAADPFNGQIVSASVTADVTSDLVKIHGSALTETAGQLAGRFVDFFDQASATFSVATALADFKATGFSTHTAADVRTEMDNNSTQLVAIVADTNELQTDWTDGGRLDVILDSLSSLTGEDAFTGTITVDDGSTALEGAVVGMRRGGVLKASGSTDASGEITDWTCGAYTYDLAVRLDGYQPATDTMTVTADGWSKTVSLTALTPAPATDPTLSSARIFARDNLGALSSGETVQVQQTGVPSGSTQQAFDGTIQTHTSDANGYVDLTLIRDASYRWRYGTHGSWIEFTPNAASYAVNSDVSGSVG